MPVPKLTPSPGSARPPDCSGPASGGQVFAKVFTQIFDSSIVEKPEVRFTFTDLLTLCDPDGVVDMTHEAIARRTNRPLQVIRDTIAELEGPDPRSRTKDFAGARIKRLDSHRDWGWLIINYRNFRKIASEEQRREKTLARVHKHRKSKELRSVTLCNAGNVMQKKREMKKKMEYPTGSDAAFIKLFEEWMEVRKGIGKKPKDWDMMFQTQLAWIAKQPRADWPEILAQSIRNGWQGLFPAKQKGMPASGKSPQNHFAL